MFQVVVSWLLLLMVFFHEGESLLEVGLDFTEALAHCHDECQGVGVSILSIVSFPFSVGLRFFVAKQSREGALRG